MMRYQGSCHCGALQFEVEAAEDLVLQECNCSICSKVGYLHLIVPKAKFNLRSGHDNITTYTFNTGVAQHTFCKTCGVKPFYTPRSNPSGMSVNYRCLNTQAHSVKIEPFDGQNWEANAEHLAHLSQTEEPS
jgi:hypothetical protein